MDLDSGILGTHRGGADIQQAFRGGADQDDTIPERRRVRRAAQDVGSGNVGKTPLGSAKRHQRLDPLVHGDRDPAQGQPLHAGVRGAGANVGKSRFHRIHSQGDPGHCQGQRLIEIAVIFEKQRHAANHAVTIRLVHEMARSARIGLQRGKIAGVPA